MINIFLFNKSKHVLSNDAKYSIQICHLQYIAKVVEIYADKATLKLTTENTQHKNYI